MNQIINTRPWRGKVIILPNPKSNAQREANPKKNAGVNRKKWKRTVDIDGAVRNQRRRLSSIGALGGRVFGRDFPGRRLWLGDSSRDVALRLLVETLHILRCRRHNPFLFLSLSLQFKFWIFGIYNFPFASSRRFRERWRLFIYLGVVNKIGPLTIMGFCLVPNTNMGLFLV